jgi:hypothetical protein
VNRDEIRPGVVIVVPKEADRTRPGMAYQLEAAAVYDHPEHGWVRVGGQVRRADGTPSTRRYGYRDADLRLEAISAAPAGAAR